MNDRLDGLYPVTSHYSALDYVDREVLQPRRSILQD